MMRIKKAGENSLEGCCLKDDQGILHNGKAKPKAEFKMSA
jgi:hypothetical protein